MTKDWDSVQHHIRDLSMVQQKPLDEVKAIMESKHAFRASTRAYRLKLKEWGYLRLKDRRPRAVPAKKINISQSSDEALPDHLQAENSILNQVPRSGTEQVMALLATICDGDSSRLETLLRSSSVRAHINHPLGLPFQAPGLFHDSPALQNCVVLQHPNQTLLDIASGLTSTSIVQMLLMHGAKSSVHPFGTDLALHNAIRNSRVSIVEALLTAGVNPNGQLDCSWQPLRQAAFWNSPAIVRMLLKHGADVNPTSFQGTPFKSPLQLVLDRRAAEYRNPQVRESTEEILKMLLYAGANVSAEKTVDLDGRTPFETFLEPWQSDPQWSSHLSPIDCDCLQYFVTKGAELRTKFTPLDCSSSFGRTFEHQILWHANPATGRLLIDHANVQSGGNGSNALHEIVGSCPDAKRHPADTMRDIEVLLKRGADPNTFDKNGYTALTLCLELCPSSDVLERVTLLLQKGNADPLLRDKNGYNPVFMAIRLFEDPLRLQLAEVLISRYLARGLGTRKSISHINQTLSPVTLDDSPMTSIQPHLHSRSLDEGFFLPTPNKDDTQWLFDYFPFSSHISLDGVQRYSFESNFTSDVQKRLPPDIRATFQKAALGVATRTFLDSEVRAVMFGSKNNAVARPIAKLRDRQILDVVKMRKDAGLPDYAFPQAYVTDLLESLVQPAASLSLVARSPSAEDSFSRSQHQHQQPWKMGSPLYPATDKQQNLRTVPSADPSMLPTARMQSSFYEAFSPPTPPQSQPAGDSSKTTRLYEMIGRDRYRCLSCRDGRVYSPEDYSNHEREHMHALLCSLPQCGRRFCLAKDFTINTSLV